MIWHQYQCNHQTGHHQRDYRTAASLANVIAIESCKINSHEGDQRAKVEHLRPESVTKDERPNERNCADKNHIIPRYTAFSIHHAEE